MAWKKEDKICSVDREEYQWRDPTIFTLSSISWSVQPSDVACCCWYGDHSDKEFPLGTSLSVELKVTKKQYWIIGVSMQADMLWRYGKAHQTNNTSPTYQYWSQGCSNYASLSILWCLTKWPTPMQFQPHHTSWKYKHYSKSWGVHYLWSGIPSHGLRKRVIMIVMMVVYAVQGIEAPILGFGMTVNCGQWKSWWGAGWKPKQKNESLYMHFCKVFALWDGFTIQQTLMHSLTKGMFWQQSRGVKISNAPSSPKCI